MRHHLYIKDYNGSLRGLAIDMGAMRYDKVAELLGYLAKELARQSKRDKEKGRKQLAALLKTASKKMKVTQKQMGKIFHLCQPYLKKA